MIVQKVLSYLENLSDDLYTIASKTMMDASIIGIFDGFENMLANDVMAVMYQYKTFQGKADFVNND